MLSNAHNVVLLQLCKNLMIIRWKKSGFLSLSDIYRHIKLVQYIDII
jgi:hypothetical protein